MRDKIVMIALSFGLLVGCVSIPPNAEAVRGFDVDKYLGTWYEIARLDFRFERNLDNTSAQYRLDSKGNVVVVNSGFNYVTKNWHKVEGVAKFRGDDDVAELKVSFFWPFYSGYNVVALDRNYQYALVTGKNLDYLWILSRDRYLPESVKSAYLKIARNIGYDTSKLIWVEHERTDNPYLHED